MIKKRLVIIFLLMISLLSVTANAWCTDSDGGIVYTVKGWAEDDYSGVLWDACTGWYLSGEGVREYYCNPYVVLGSDYDCASLGDDWSCNDGKCVQAPPPPPPTDKIFTSHIISSSADVADSVFAIDVNDDGHMDVLSASRNDDKIAWYENNGSETFTEHIITTNANGANDVFAIDVNDDGHMDVLSASRNDDKIAWYENNGSETFTEHIITTNASGARSVFAIDMDNDNDIDVLSASKDDNKVAWYENDGNENFITHIINSSVLPSYPNSHPVAVYAIDLDNDTDIDVISANYDNSIIIWYENNGSEYFTPYNLYNYASHPMDVYAIDVDGDGDIDVLGASEFNDKIAWYENQLPTYKTGWGQRILTDSAECASAVYAIDLDNDSDIDVFSASWCDDKIAWYENNNSVFTERIITLSAIDANDVFAIDIDGDGDIDVLSASMGDDKIVWYENIPVLCTDTDGINFNITGYMSSRGEYYPGNYTDVCESVVSGYNLSYTTVLEYYCTDNDGDGEIFECQDYGPEWDCWQGHCSDNVTANCTDSDGGLDYYIKGITSDKEITYEDICTSAVVGDPNLTTVNEYWCEEDGWLNGAAFECKNYGPDWLCVEGKCEYSLANCTDTDGGFIPTTKGITTDDIGVFVDYCKYNDTGNYSDQTIREYWCNGIAQGSWLDCKTFGSEYVCYDGECTAGNQRPLLFSVTSYGNETGYPEGRHHTAYSHNQRIWWEVDVVDLESDSVFVAVDCDLDVGPPYVSDWGAPNQLNTKFLNCTYDIGNYTAKIYVTDQDNWGVYDVWMEDELIIVECLTYEDCDEGYLCTEYGDCYVPSNVTNCTDSDSGLDFNTSGYVTTPWDTIYDECSSSTVVRERICSPSAPSGYESVLFNCITYGSDWVCYEGQCDNTTDTIMVTMNVKDYDTDALISGITYTIVQNPSYTVVASGTVSSGLVQFSVELGYNYQIILSDDSLIYKRWYEPKWSPESTINVYVEKYCTGNCMFEEGFEYADSPYHHGWRSSNYSTTYHSNYGFMLDLDLTQTTNDIYVEFEESTSAVQIVTYQVLLTDETPAKDNDVNVYLEDDTGGDIFIMRYLVDSNEIGQIYFFDTEWRHALISQDIDLETPITTRLVYNDGVIDIYLDVLSNGNEVLYSENNPVIHTYSLEQLRIDPDTPTYDRSIYIDNIEITQSAVEPQEVEPGSPTSPSEADLDSPWYRDESGDLKFDASKCEGWKSMLMCAGWKYTIGKIAVGVAWIFTGIHILYFIVILLLIIIIGPLIVEWRKKR